MDLRVHDFLNSLSNDELVRVYKTVKPLARGDQQKLIDSSPKHGLPKPTGLSGYLSRDGPHNNDAKARALLIETLRSESHLIDSFTVAPISVSNDSTSVSSTSTDVSALSSNQLLSSSSSIGFPSLSVNSDSPWTSPMSLSSSRGPDLRIEVDPESLREHEIRSLRLDTVPSLSESHTLEQLYMELGRLEYERRKINQRIETIVAKISLLQLQEAQK